MISFNINSCLSTKKSGSRVLVLNSCNISFSLFYFYIYCEISLKFFWCFSQYLSPKTSVYFSLKTSHPALSPYVYLFQFWLSPSSKILSYLPISNFLYSFNNKNLRFCNSFCIKMSNNFRSISSISCSWIFG